MKFYSLILLGLLAFFCGKPAQAQTSVRHYWETSPEFSSEEKDLVLNVLDSLPQLKLPHRIYGDMVLLESDSTNLGLQTSAEGKWALRLLPMANGAPLLAVIHTVSSPIEDSSLQFYTPQWESVPSEDLFRVDLNDLLPANLSEDDRTRLGQLLYPLYLTYRWLSGGRLEVKVSMPILLNDSSREGDKSLIESLVPREYRWDGSHFSLIK